MEKQSFLIALIMAISCFTAQGQGSGGGGVAVEYQASPLGAISPTNPGYIRAKFIAGSLGFRLTGTGYMTNDEVRPEAILHTGFFDLRPGAEFHTSLGKASPYAGAELIFMNKSANKNSTDELGVANATDEYGSDRAFFGIGAGVFVGVDYYLGDQFYIGFEVGLEGVNRNKKEVTMADEVIFEETKEFTLNSTLFNAFKLGFNF